MVGLPTNMPVAIGTEFKVNGGKIARVTEEDGKFLVHACTQETAWLCVWRARVVPRTRVMQVFCAQRLEFPPFLAPQVLDANHPFAGKGLVLKMTLMDITNLSNCNVDSLSFEEDC
jgi:hypothetical protein